MGSNKSFYSHHNFYIKPNYLVSIPSYEFTEPKLRTDLQRENQKHLKDNNQNGIISYKVDKKIRNAVNWLFVSAKNKRIPRAGKNYDCYFKLNFITLTLPSYTQTCTDNEFKNNYLKKFLFNFRYKAKVLNYVWKVESNSNGVIHCHLTSDAYIDMNELQLMWNKVIKDSAEMKDYHNKHSTLSFDDYLLLYPTGNLYDKKTKILKKVITLGDRQKSYENGVKCNWSNPASTQVKAVRKIKNLQSYICSYLAKNETNNRKIKGRLWGSNYNISDAQKLKSEVQIHNHSDVEKFINNPELEYKHIEGKKDVFGNAPIIGQVYFMNEMLWNKAPDILKDTYNDMRMVIRKGTGTINYSKQSQSNYYSNSS